MVAVISNADMLKMFAWDIDNFLAQFLATATADYWQHVDLNVKQWAWLYGVSIAIFISDDLG
jgi:hypothetical protein